MLNPSLWIRPPVGKRTLARGRNWPLVRAGEPLHGELDRAIGRFAPAFDRAHIGLLGIALQELARLAARHLARQRERLAQKTVIGPLAAGHPVCQVTRTDRVTRADWVTW